MEIILWCIGVCIIAVWALLRPGRVTPAQRDMMSGVNFAHRGLHTQDKATPENSLPAFAAAVQAGYGIELDIQLSADGRVMVFHDDTLDRVCGVHGRVDAFSFDELRALRLCGTSETLPLLTEVFETINTAVPMIIELKTGPRRTQLCETALPLLRAYPGAFCIESFDPRIVAWFRKNAPDILRGQLTDSCANFVREKQPRVQAFALSHLLLNAAARPQFIAHGPGKKALSVRVCEAMGALRVCWTAREEAAAAKKQAENDAVIFEFYRPQPHWEA